MRNNKIKNRKLVNALLILTTISFTACGNGNSTTLKESSEENSIEDSYEKISISKICTSPDTIDDCIELKSGDQVVKDEEGTKVNILHDENDVKKICLLSGKAHINRAYTE